MKANIQNIVVVSALVCWAFGVARAETIFLRNGQYVSGSLVSQDDLNIVVRTDRGNRTIPKSRIRRIVYTETSAEARRELEERTRLEESRRHAEQRERRLALERRSAAEREEARHQAQERARQAARREAALREARNEALLRAVLAPGLGHLHRGRDTEGALLLGAGVFAAAFLFSEHAKLAARSVAYRHESRSLIAVTALSPVGASGNAAVGIALAHHARRAEVARLRHSETMGEIRDAGLLFGTVYCMSFFDHLLFSTPQSGPGGRQGGARIPNHVRSALLPGWGQLTQGRTQIGALQMTLFGISALGVARSLAEGAAWRRSYRDAVNGSLLIGAASGLGESIPGFPSYRNLALAQAWQTQAVSRHAYTRAQQKLSFSIAGLVGSYTWSVADAIRRTPPRSAFFSVTPQADRLFLSWTTPIPEVVAR